jgi:hypothetical protein
MIPPAAFPNLSPALGGFPCLHTPTVGAGTDERLPCAGMKVNLMPYWRRTVAAGSGVR